MRINFRFNYFARTFTIIPLFMIAMRARRRGETRSSDYAAGKVRGSIDRRRMVATHFGQDPNGGTLAELDEVTIWELWERWER